MRSKPGCFVLASLLPLTFIVIRLLVLVVITGKSKEATAIRQWDGAADLDLAADIDGRVV